MMQIETPTPTLRSFVAVPLPGAVQAAIAEGAGALARALPRGAVKWSRKVENFHVTLKFLGPVAVDRLDALAVALGDALASVPPFGFTVRGFGAFPAGSHAQVLFAGVEDVGRGLAAVAEIVETVAERFGFPREARAFTGHVTVGRGAHKAGKTPGFDARAALEPFAGRDFGAAFVDEVHVYESRLAQRGEDGSTYVLRARAPLGARGPN